MTDSLQENKKRNIDLHYTKLYSSDNILKWIEEQQIKTITINDIILKPVEFFSDTKSCLNLRTMVGYNYLERLLKKVCYYHDGQDIWTCSWISD